MVPVLTASAANYNIWVCGKTVTDDNKGDVLGDGAVSFVPTGSVYYLYLKKSISWNNGSSMAAINSMLGAELRIVVTGDVSVNRTMNGGAISHNNQLSITCDGTVSKLTATGTGSNSDGAIYAEGGISIKDAVVDASGGPYGIHAGGKLEITESTVSAKGTTSAIYGDGGLSLGSDMGVIIPEAGQIFGADIRDAEGNRATEVLLEPVKSFDLKVCGKTVNSANAGDIMGDGVFAYDDETKKLTISGDCEYMGNMIESSIAGLTINVAKDSTLKPIDGHAILLYADATITGGRLTVAGALSCLYVSGCTLTIKNADLALSGKNGLAGDKEAKLLVEKSTISAKGSTAAVNGFASIALTDCYVREPENAATADGSVKVDGALANDVLIVPGKPGEPVVLDNPFVDVKESDYFYDAVLWAYYAKPQVTNGLDATHFGPAVTCTRGQIVTFLWRALGEPAPSITKNPFEDVKESDYFYKAVLWAVEKGVTNGVDDTHFAPNANCKREHAVAFLYRAAGKPAYTAKDNPFEDVAKDAYYYDAVLWAVEKNITKGMDEKHFGPSAACQRSQIVTFLYRFMNP